MLDFATILTCLVGYLAGSIPFGLVLTKAAGLGDIRKIGSGNIGATNVLRTGNKTLAAATLILDALKGAVVVLVVRALTGRDDLALLSGLAAVLGHLFPVWLKFKGGKGVATGLAVLVAAAWPVGVGACVIWLISAAISRMSSLAALVAFATAPVTAIIIGDPGAVKLSFTIAVLVFIRHQANIRRILAGTEPKIGKGGKKRA